MKLGFRTALGAEHLLRVRLCDAQQFACQHQRAKAVGARQASDLLAASQVRARQSGFAELLSELLLGGAPGLEESAVDARVAALRALGVRLIRRSAEAHPARRCHGEVECLRF